MDQQEEPVSVAVADKPSPPYLSFSTFFSVIENLENGVPHRIDKSLFRSQSGTVQGQILASLRFLGLVDDNYIPTNYLNSMVLERERRKEILSEVLRFSYQDIFRIGLERATSKQLEDEFKRLYSISGDTLRKVIVFFLKAVEYAEIPISFHLKAGRRKTGNGKRKTSSGVKKNAVVENENVSEETPGPSTEAVVKEIGVSRTIELKTGGSMTLMVSINPFEMDAEDRGFVYQIIDLMKDYEKKKKES